MIVPQLRSHTVSVVVALLAITLCGAQSTQTAASSNSVNDLADTAFIGYYVKPTTVDRLTAGGGKAWVTSASYAADCTDSASCLFPVGCGSNSLTYGNGDVQDCGSQASCVAFTIFQTSPYGLPSAMNYGCRAAWSAYTVYRANPATAAVTSTTMSTQKTSEVSTTAAPLTTAATQSQTAMPTPDPSASSTSESKAWIAGAVIGPIVGLAIIALIVWFLMRKKRRDKGRSEATAMPPTYTDHGGQYGYIPQYGSTQPSEMEGVRKIWPQEMSGFSQPVELPSSR
ncbi:hypothetical protein AB5N19_03986 [Seiridium cardinale]